MPNRRRNLFWPLLLIIIGALLLAQGLGLLPSGLWAALVQLWPVLLIVAGLDLLIGWRSRGAAVLVAVLGALVVSVVLTWAALRASAIPPDDVQLLYVARQGAERLSARIRFQTGQLSLGALAPSDYVLEGTAHNGAGDSVEQQYTVLGGEGRLALSQANNPLLAPFLAGRVGKNNWELRLAPSLPLALEIDTGDASASLDLSGLALTSLDLTTGAGETHLSLPPAAARASLHTGGGATTLTLPAGSAARLTIQPGRANITIPEHLTANGQTYTTPNFDPAAPFLDLDLSASTGPVTIN